MSGHTHAADGRRIDIVYRDHVKHVLSRLLGEIPKGQKITILTHSSSGGALERNMQEDDSFAQLINERSTQIIHLGAFLETANSSSLFKETKRYSYLYSLAAATPRFRDKRTGETPLDRCFLGIPSNVNETKYLTSIEGNAHHGQAGALKAGGQQHLKATMRNPDPESYFQQISRTFFHGDQDTAACHKTVQHYADELLQGAHCEILQGMEHDLLSVPRFRQELIQFMKDGAPPSRSHYAALDAPLRRLQAV